MSRPSRRELERELDKIGGSSAPAASVAEFVDELLTDGFDVSFGGDDTPPGSELLVEADDYSITVATEHIPEWVDVDEIPVTQ